MTGGYSSRPDRRDQSSSGLSTRARCYAPSPSPRPPRRRARARHTHGPHTPPLKSNTPAPFCCRHPAAAAATRQPLPHRAAAAAFAIRCRIQPLPPHAPAAAAMPWPA
eukprot:6594259-Prymnesium_polylepis.1